MRSRSRRVLLVSPPYADVTYPYHALSYVAGPLRAAGYRVDILDMNAAWFRSAFTRGRVRGWSWSFAREVEDLDRRRSLDIEAQDRLVDLLRGLAICRRLSPESAVATLRSEDFYEVDRYLEARSQIRAFEELLTLRYGPYNFSTAFAVPPHEPNAAALVSRAMASRALVDDLAAELRDRCGTADYLFCGVSVPFSAQLLPGMALLMALRQVFPGAALVAGGTAISDIIKYKRTAASLEPLGAVCDVLYMGEAETGVVALADWCRGARVDRPSQAIDLGDLPADGSRQALPYVSLGAGQDPTFAPYSWADRPPDYSWADWDLYLAPERRINYAPSRGCFWDKCTFCDYGLNGNGPTAPSRTMDVETVLGHLRPLIAQGIRHVYFAVDALAPRFVAAFADKVLAEGLEFHWSSQFFLTRSFTPALTAKIAASGLRLASFGLESGSSRILERMGKGPGRVEQVLRPALDAFRSSPIGLQPLFFFGFPGETDADRQETVDFLLDHLDVLGTVSRAGQFTLLPGSMVAKRPDDFGVTSIRRSHGDDIAGNLEYSLTDGTPTPACRDFEAFNDQLPHCLLFERPWAGGIDSFHSQLYAERYGPGVFHQIRQTHGGYEPEMAELGVTSAYDLHEVFENVLIHRAWRSPGIAGLGGRREIVESVATVTAPVEPRDRPEHYEMRLRPYRDA